MNPAYPIELNLAGREVVVAGGGTVAARKVAGLLEAGARVRVVSPSFVEELAGRGDVTLQTQAYDASVLHGALLVFACTDDPALNRRVADDARAAGALCNVADDPPNCDFMVPAVLRRGRLTVAVGTSGASPALAAALRDRLEELLEAEYAQLVEELAQVRAEIREQAEPEDLRRRIFQTLCRECSLKLLRARGVQAWRAWMRRVVRHHLEGRPGSPPAGGQGARRGQ